MGTIHETDVTIITKAMSLALESMSYLGCRIILETGRTFLRGFFSLVVN